MHVARHEEEKKTMYTTAIEGEPKLHRMIFLFSILVINHASICFSKDILEQLEYSSDDISPNLLAFVGMYRGPFWAIIELQSRWITSIFSSLLTIPSVATQHRAGRSDQGVMDEMNSLSAEANNRHFIAGAVFRALHQSKWTFERTLTGQPANGIVDGQAEFHSSSNQDELLYKEQGKLILPSQSPLDITQKYLYAYDKWQDLLSVYFIDEKNQRSALFHTIHFQSKQVSASGWMANGEHLCDQDHYSASYLFVFNGLDLVLFEITYQVKGPAKDYLSKTIFHPDKIFRP